MTCDLRTFRIEVGPGVQASVTPVSHEDGIDIYRIAVARPAGEAPTPVTLRWEEDMVNILSVWNPTGRRNRNIYQWFAPTVNESRFCFGAPILCTVGEGGGNNATVSLADVRTPVSLSFCVKDLQQEYRVEYAVSLFTGACTVSEAYETYLRVDSRDIPYYESIGSVSAWWAEMGYAVPPCPPAAEDALYSSWYNFHQAPDGEKLLRDLEIAADLGFRTVILDDGWQFDGPSIGTYALCGSWEVARSKFPDFRAFTDRVHALGMKLMVWFTVPFVGVKSPLFDRFAGKYLWVERELFEAGTVDPRYPEVRSWIVDTYRRFLTDYDIDGFKLDFIDSFRITEESAPFSPGMDCASVDDAVERLLEEIRSELAAVKPDLLYEYRQNYIGPAINRFGNMLRVGDCAYDALTNRIGIADLRLMGYPTAVHADMLFWSRKESLRLCARQLLNILFAVPQISVILDESTDGQKALLRHYLAYWQENRDILLHGTFRPLHPEQNFNIITAEDDSKIIAVHHMDAPFTWTGKAADVFHNGDADRIIVDNPTGDTLRARLFNCLGHDLGVADIPARSVISLPLPPTGMVRIRKA